MKTSPTLLALLLLPTLAAALTAQSCAGGETTGAGNTGGSSGTSTGGRTGTGTGGFTSTSTGGFTGTGTGGFTSTNTGGFIGTSTGGLTGTGTGGAVGPGTGGSVVTGGGLVTMTGGFATNGTWMGYAYTATFGTTATISPVCPLPCFTGAMPALCASGSVGADTTFASGALVGWNVNQMMSVTATMPAIGTIVPTGTGLYVNVSGSGTGLRAQIQNGATQQWCALLPGPGATMIPWGMFNTACYNTALGTAYPMGTPITAVQIVVPSTALTPVPFNICLVDAHSY